MDRNEALMLRTAGMNLEVMVLSERSQTQATGGQIAFGGNVQNRDTKETDRASAGGGENGE